MFIEIMRWIGLGMSLFAFAVSCYSLWLSCHTNKDLSRRNADLYIETAKLRKKNEEYEAEILRLRGLLELRGERNDLECDCL